MEMELPYRTNTNCCDNNAGVEEIYVSTVKTNVGFCLHSLAVLLTEIDRIFSAFLRAIEIGVKFCENSKRCTAGFPAVFFSIFPIVSGKYWLLLRSINSR